MLDYEVSFPPVNPEHGHGRPSQIHRYPDLLVAHRGPNNCVLPHLS